MSIFSIRISPRAMKMMMMIGDVYSQARNIHLNEEAMSCNPESLDISPEDLVVSDDVTVVWGLKSL